MAVLVGSDMSACYRQQSVTLPARDLTRPIGRKSGIKQVERVGYVAPRRVPRRQPLTEPRGVTGPSPVPSSSSDPQSTQQLVRRRPSRTPTNALPAQRPQVGSPTRGRARPAAAPHTRGPSSHHIARRPGHHQGPTRLFLRTPTTKTLSVHSRPPPPEPLRRGPAATRSLAVQISSQRNGRRRALSTLGCGLQDEAPRGISQIIGENNGRAPWSIDNDRGACGGDLLGRARGTITYGMQCRRL